MIIIMIIINNNLDEVSMISGRIKVEASVISRGLRLLISQKPNSIIVLLYIVLWKIYKSYWVKC